MSLSVKQLKHKITGAATRRSTPCKMTTTSSSESKSVKVENDPKRFPFELPSQIKSSESSLYVFEGVEGSDCFSRCSVDELLLHASATQEHSNPL